MSPAKTIDESPYTLPEAGFVRQKELDAILPFSRTTLWRKVKDGTFPAPVKLSAGVTAWRAEEIRAWMGPIHSTRVPPLPAPNAAPTFAHGGGREEVGTTVKHTQRVSESRPATASEKRLERQWMAEATAWREAELLRAYITHIIGAVVAAGGMPSSELSAWLVRATQAAARLDPTQARMTDAGAEHIRAGMAGPK